MRFDELGKLVQAPSHFVRIQRRGFSHRCRLHVNREVLGQARGQVSGLVGPREPGDCGEQRAVVLVRFGHLVVQAFVVLPLDSIGAK